MSDIASPKDAIGPVQAIVEIAARDEVVRPLRMKEFSKREAFVKQFPAEI